MSEAHPLFDVLCKSADADCATALERLVREAPDRRLNRINVLDFARREGLNEQRAITAFLHATQIGLLDMSWNVLCPSCGGVLDANATLKTVRSKEYYCAFCACSSEATLDDLVEVSFTVSPRVRKIAAHNPDDLPIWEYHRQMFWGTGVDLPDEKFDATCQKLSLDAVELPAGEKALLSLKLPAEFVIVFEPVTHAAQYIEVKGEPTGERQNLALVYNNVLAPTGTLELRPGPLRLSLENRTGGRVLPTVWIAANDLQALTSKRRPFLNAKRLLSNQTFRDIYRTHTLGIDQRLKITSLTFLFTDLKGSTELYERVGDLVAFDLVREHFRTLNDIVASEDGAVVKTIGDAVMATFIKPEHALAAGLRMRAAMKKLNDERGKQDLIVKIGIHEGPCLAVMLNERQDYFGQTVNVAARVQSLSTQQEIHITAPVIDSPEVVSILQKAEIRPIQKEAALRGIADKMVVYEIP
jgi:class 3 adenylate cyclase